MSTRTAPVLSNLPKEDTLLTALEGQVSEPVLALIANTLEERLETIACYVS